MPAVLVHGNPETDAIWTDLVSQLDRDDVVRISLPGFGSAIPDGFQCTREGYQQWLVAELSGLEGPIDLVGHDVGGIIVIAVAMARPDLLRSWASDSAGVFHPSYTWHELAQVWQTPGSGERAVAEWMTGSLDQKRALAESIGASGSVADSIAHALNQDMERAILQFYRSAAQPAMSELGQSLPLASACAGLVLIPTTDPFGGSIEMRCESAERANASTVELAELGHLWMLENPSLGASILKNFWLSLNADTGSPDARPTGWTS